MATSIEQIPHVVARMVPYQLPSSSYYLIMFIVTLSVAFQACQFIRRDYHTFHRLGRGGTPKTLLGYLRVSWLWLHAHRKPFLPPPLTPDILPSSGYLLRLPRRSEPRPNVAGLSPQRQLNPSTKFYADMEKALRHLANVNPIWVKVGASCFEKHGLALFLTSSMALQYHSTIHLNQTCRETGEICHLHGTVSFSVK